jgi:hypothetical protein
VLCKAGGKRVGYHGQQEVDHQRHVRPRPIFELYRTRSSPLTRSLIRPSRF